MSRCFQALEGRVCRRMTRLLSAAQPYEVQHDTMPQRTHTSNP